MLGQGFEMNQSTIYFLGSYVCSIGYTVFAVITLNYAKNFMPSGFKFEEPFEMDIEDTQYKKFHITSL